jgi:hypothetical protein
MFLQFLKGQARDNQIEPLGKNWKWFGISTGEFHRIFYDEF